MQQKVSLAELRAKSYDWTGAAEAYRAAIDATPRSDTARLAELWEERGYSLLQASTQSGTTADFLARLAESAVAYERGRDLYDKLGDTGGELRCRAMLSWATFWRTLEVSQRKKLIQETWSLSEKALEVLEKVKDGKGFWKTWSRLMPSGIFRLIYEYDHSVNDALLNQLLKDSEIAMNFLSPRSPTELAQAYVMAAGLLDWSSSVPSDPESQQKSRTKSREYWEKALALSEEVAYLQFLIAGPSPAFFGTGSDLAFTETRKMLDYARKSRDRASISTGLDALAFHSVWKSRGVEDPAEQTSLLDQALQYAQQVKEQIGIFPFTTFFNPLIWSDEPFSFYFFEMSRLEYDPVKKKALLEKAMETVPRLLKLADDSEIPYNVGLARHHVSKILESLARLEADPVRKRRLLETALEHRRENIRIVELSNPHYYWDHGVSQNYMANILYELSQVEPDADGKKRLLNESVLAKERGLDDWHKAMPMIGKSPASIETFGERYMEYGGMLGSTDAPTSSGQRLASQGGAYERAVEMFERSGTTSRVAEGFWKLAQTRDVAMDYVKAAEAFRRASEGFRMAAERMPQLKAFYAGQSYYMEAWSNIETAKQHHARQEYEAAARAYDKAAEFHRSTEQWSYLAPNYSAWAEVESAEDLSRKDQTDQAILAFQRAEKLFRESKNTLSQRSQQTMGPDEKEMVSKLISVAKAREDYCRCRITLEEAKSLDRAGDHNSSAEKYGQAVHAFEKLISELRTDEPPAEFKLILALSRAWQKLSMAEAEASPELHLEAATLFEQAKQFSPTEKSKMLALGHSRFCKALEAGVRFSDTRDRSFHEKAVQQLESAANYYVKAGFEYASEYVKACKLLFDGYVYVDEANKERDHEKKTRLYAMAERVLEGSADSYQKSHYPGKRDEVLALLKKVREDREIAGSLSDILHGPRVMSSTASFNMPTPTFEKAVGLEMFEHAAVQASLIVHSREVKVGDDIDMEIELVNAGRGTAQLIKLEHIVPEGFNVTSQSDNYRLEDSFLNMKGRSLSPLKTEEVKLVARPKTRGRFTVRPRILYLDETGSYKSYEPDPIEINVKELGLSGWVKGR